MDIVFLIGRIIVGIYWIFGGYAHFAQAQAMIPWTQSKGVPFPGLAVRGSGAMIIIGGLSIMLGLYPLVGVALIVLFIIPVASTMHNFWTIQDPMARQMDMTFFMKDFCMLGCTLMFGAIPQPWVLSLAF
jgi:putative oxidoreductase